MESSSRASQRYLIPFMKSICLSDKLDQDHLLTVLASLPQANRYLIACSGGLDSSVLLHLFHSVSKDIESEIGVIYVDHGLHAESENWGKHCASLCEDYGLKFISLKVAGSPDKGESIEDWARQQRYALLSEYMQQNDVVVTAHQLDDQLETFFLNLLRGAGARGLSAMPVIREFANGLLVRPLLPFSRAQLEAYAEQHGLKWIIDSSNEDIEFDRNYLRHQLLPVIKERWPSYQKTIARLISQQAETRQILDERAERDLECASISGSVGLNFSVVNALSDARKKNLLAYWIKRNGMSLPNAKLLEQILSDIFLSSPEKSPCVNWDDVELRRYGNQLYLMKRLADDNNNCILPWDIESPFQFNNQSISVVKQQGDGVAASFMNHNQISVRFRQGGETIRPYPEGKTKTIKQLFQEARVLPWCRQRYPLIYINDELVAVPGICIDKKFHADANQEAYHFIWSAQEQSVQAHD